LSPEFPLASLASNPGYALARCRDEVPPLREVAPGHRAACHLV
jgi:peptide/nickel transport system ATP-binding protein